MKTQDSRRKENISALLSELDEDVQHFLQKLLRIEREHLYEDPPPNNDIRSECVRILKELV